MASDTPPALAEAARSWLDHVHYGLWQVSGPVPRPGLWLTDLVSATRRYVQLSPDQGGVLAPWAVLAGAVVPRAKGPKARRAFVEAWADQPLDELRGLTARQAAADERRWVELEALLRNLEHDAARAGESCEWLEWVREELDLGGIAPAARAAV